MVDFLVHDEAWVPPQRQARRRCLITLVSISRSNCLSDNVLWNSFHPRELGSFLGFWSLDSFSRSRSIAKSSGPVSRDRPPCAEKRHARFAEAGRVKVVCRMLETCEVRDFFDTVAEGNTVVIQQELAHCGRHVDLRVLQRAVAPLPQEQKALALATVRFETPPGQQIQIDFGEKFVKIAGQRVKVYFVTAVLGYSRRLYCRAFLASPPSLSSLPSVQNLL